MTTKKTLITPSRPVARRFIRRSFSTRSASRLTGGVEDEDARPIAPADAPIDADSVGDSGVRTSSMAGPGRDPSLLLPGGDASDTGPTQCLPGRDAARGEGHRQVLDAVDEPREQAG